ncbi:DUF6443 domain-containing protein [Parapedobacter deserti]|uniref:DUF6443 domain-containing protein n=1 Tax=Parapedobacter deserti TaxID=1912957 RepID=A0ABV7JNA5_9SPHI
MNRLSVGIPLFIAAIFIFIPKDTIGQGANPVFTSYSGQSELYGTQSVTLSGGFEIPLGYNVLIHVTSSNVSNPYSSDRNYILTTAYNVPLTVSVADPTVQQASRQIAYFDGFGRPVQQIAIKGSPTNKDVVVPLAYDAYGRQSTSYLPYTTNSAGNGFFKTSAITEQQSFYTSGVSGQSSNGYPYSKTVYDLSPAARIKEQGEPGAHWQPLNGSIPGSGRTVKLEATVNGAGIPKYSVSLSASNEPTLEKNGDYGHYQLAISITKDENWTLSDGKAGTTEKYTDKDGRVILERAYNKNGATVVTLSTHYVYDDWGRLAFVLPPGTNPDTNTPNSSAIATFGYKYQYDDYGRKVEQTLPGKGVEYFVYNKRHQLVASQDANQRGRNEWMISKYDAHGRLIITGLWTNNNTAISRTSLQTVLNGQSAFWESRNTATATHGYTNVVWPTNISAYFLVNYYDTYDIAGLPGTYAYQSYGSNVHIAKAPGLQTGSKTWPINSASTTLWSVTYYDIDAQVIQVQSANHLGGKDIVSSSYNFTGKVVTTQRVHTGSGGQSVTVNKAFAYDDAGRLLTVKQQTGPDAEITLAHRTYNEVGQVIDKKLHLKAGQTKYLQSVDYRYNARGWLTSINDPNLANGTAANIDDASSDSDLYGMALDYENASFGPQYNGNIAGIRWKTSKPPSMAVSPPQLGYRFSYDALGQLTTAQSGTNGTYNGNHSEQISYTNTGNINRIERWAYRDNAKRLIDDLTFSYTGYRHTRIDDAAGAAYKALGFNDAVQQADEYAYDGNGNATKDANKGITTISYNVFNLPEVITFSTSPVKKIEYLYDRSGVKLQRKYTEGSAVMTTDYVAGIQYEQGQLAFVHTDAGRARKDGSSYRYEYDLVDHLGSTRVTFDANPSDPNQTTARVLQQTAYYPYGLAMLNDPASNLNLSFVSGAKNNYLYSGKELQEQGGLNWYDHGARMYDPAIGRWNVMDPARQFSNPFLAMGNNPVIYVDPDGEWIHIVIGAVIGGIVNTITHWDEVAKGGFWEGAKAFGVGAAAGGLGAATGGAALVGFGASATTVAGGFVAGSVGSLYGDMALGMGNMFAFGDPYEMTPSRLGSVALMGGITGGLTSGVSNWINGANFWTGRFPVEVGVPRITQFGNRVVQDATKGGVANARALGMAGEQAVGLSGAKTAIQVGGKTRIPDALTRTTLTEVKNVKSLSFTRQLRDFHTYSQQNGLDFILYTRPNTTLSGPLQQAINNGSIIHRFIP